MRIYGNELVSFISIDILLGNVILFWVLGTAYSSTECSECNARFPHRRNLNAHLRHVHKLQPAIVAYDENIFLNKCMDCKTSYRTVGDLETHLQMEHEFKFERKELIFQNWQGKPCSFHLYVWFEFFFNFFQNSNRGKLK